MIQAQNLSMHYGTVRALDSVSFKAEEREIVGLLGPNGAGKTTLMRILTTFIYPTKGTAFVCGVDVTQDPIGARKCLGYLPENPPLYTEMRVDEYLKFIGRSRGLSGRAYKGRQEWVVEKCGLAPVWKHTIFELSLGYRQRLGLAQALLHDPRVIILDEPTSGLDPIQIIGIRNLIRDLAREKTIIFSTHILQEASAISNRLLIINGGKLVAQGTPDELRSRKLREMSCRVSIDGPRTEVENALKAIPSLKNLRFAGDENGAGRFSFSTDAYQESAVALNQIAKSRNWLLKELSFEQPSLEDVFVGFFDK